MFSLAAHYLMGWSMAASDGARKEHAEWPPHPDRAFMALAAAWFETGCDEREGAALLWLEALAPPALYASGMQPRTCVAHFVPANDTGLSSAKAVQALVDQPDPPFDKLKEAGLSQLPELRMRNERRFPVAIPFEPTVHWIWNQPVPPDLHAPLQSLCEKVTHVGHSASLVQMWVHDKPPAPNLLPAHGVSAHRLRVFAKGRLDYLRQRMNRDRAVAFADLQYAIGSAKGKAKRALQDRVASEFPSGQPISQRPQAGLWQGYGEPAATAPPAAAGSFFDPRLIVFELSGPRLPLPSTLRLTDAMRGALLSHCASPMPEWLSGHAADGTASRRAHLAMLPLPFVGMPHADGRLMGVALALPRDVEPADAAHCLEPLLRGSEGAPRVLRLFDGRWFECNARLEMREAPPASLQATTWTGPARRWASVTPFVFDRHFSGPDRWRLAAQSVAVAIARVGLPPPIAVTLHDTPLFEGVPVASRFPRLARKRNGGLLAHTHVLVKFDRPVAGPVIAGAGRFRGYGLFRPLASQEELDG